MRATPTGWHHEESTMIVVTGASGHLGRLVIDALTATVDSGEVVAGVRTPDKVADLAERGVVVRRLDYDEPDTVRSALAGAAKVLLISGREVGRRVPQHQAVIDAAVAEGVSLLAYTSILRCETSPLLLAAEHRATEQAIARSGLPATLLRHGWYTENYTENLGPAFEHGTFIGSAGAGRIAAATRADFAAADAAVLTGSGHEGAVYELGGEAFTMVDLAAAVSAEVGRTIGYTDLPPVDYRAALVQAGVPGPYADVLVDADVNIAQGHLDASPSPLASLMGRPPTPLADALRAASQN
jgi:NAD(P)H dehydrogenase (quinone)